MLSVCKSLLDYSTDSFYDTFHTIADVMYFCQMLAVMEVINPVVGLVKTGVMPAFIQVCMMLATNMDPFHKLS